MRRPVAVFEELDSEYAVVIEVPESYTTRVDKLQIRLPAEDSDVLTDLLLAIADSSASAKADEQAERERITRIMADPNTPEHMKSFQCRICGQKVRYDDWDHTHSVR